MRRMRVGVVAVLTAAAALGQPAPDFRGSFVLSIDGDPVRYGDPPQDDPVARRQRRIDAGDVKLVWSEPRGYLDSVLKTLGIPLSSQGRVFSKTSFQLQRISPATPRAIYFGDEVFAGWAPGGDGIEVSAADPVRGACSTRWPRMRTVPPASAAAKSACNATLRRARWAYRGTWCGRFGPDAQGYPHTMVDSFVTNHRSPFAERWGGWFVTGAHGAMRHMGNVQAADPKDAEKLDREWGADRARAPAGLELYAAPHSDIVALITLEHQTMMHNYLARAGMEARLGA